MDDVRAAGGAIAVLVLVAVGIAVEVVKAARGRK